MIYFVMTRTEGSCFKSKICWIITLWCWISCCDSSILKNLRRDSDLVQCKSELLSDKLLLDEQFSASSHLDNKLIFQPKMARFRDVYSLKRPSDGRAWCPSTAVHMNLTEWIEVDFLRMTILSTLYTMGRGDGNFKEFTPEIVIKYQRTESGPWYIYRDSQNETNISINTDSRTELRMTLQTIVARKVRIYPLDTRTGPKSVCLKIAFLGCYFDDEVVSYTAPQGDQGMMMNQLVNLKDERYDGTKSKMLENGLGILMDNNVQMDSFDAENSINKDMNKWYTGWKCTEERRKSPISITFYFLQERVFSHIMVYHVKNIANNIRLSTPITVSIGYHNRSTYNETIIDTSSDFFTKNQVKIPLHKQKGTICTLNITCGNGNWILLTEIEIKSTKSSGQILPTAPSLNYNSSEPPWVKKQMTFLMVIGPTILLLMILLTCVAFFFYKMKRLRKYKLNKKLELVAKCSNRNLCDPSSRTVFTIQSNHPSESSIARDKYYSDSKHATNSIYAGSQLSDGVYASWPNTDEDVDVPNIDKEEEKCLLGTDMSESRSSGKDYAIYQPGFNFSGTEYLHKTRPSSTLISMPTVSSLSDKVPLSVAHLKIVSSYDIPKSTPIVTYRNNKSILSYQHLMNYRGICGDVDLRYQFVPTRSDYHGLDSNIKVLSTSHLISIQPWVRGQFGCIDLVTVALDNNVPCRYFMKKLSPDSPPAIKSKFILDLKILSTLNMSCIVRLAAIIIDGGLLSDDAADVIRSARFCLLVEHNGGYNLKEFLRNIYYPNQTQNYKTATISSQSQISTSSMLHIITQISGAMRHLEELGLIHRDIGCRNCLIDTRRQVKLYPGGYLTTQPFEDYCSIELQNHLIYFPLRWMSPESISKGVYTTKSDVWSFGVLMWEVFTLCSLMPYPSLTNEALLELMIERDNTPRLPCPQNCPREIYDLMTQCWCWNESLRPTFVDINLFLQIKTTGALSSAQLILPAPPPPLTADHQQNL